ncbi:Uncharacterised protein [[Clostridium] sordellii]|nr:hypothetical protein [Paeniclostridium sordellii]MVO75536.1 hypothetical protein [Paeniclostridium sordellii]CEN23927.1 Uncharacterised protein [[Clostridium] sordellii] [Paeniclostridium sordellii]CEP91092.1 Uncharacterised protein [[Clostridium] sordellii] [Paeniclostridium sordellii]CEP94151.1 Uncharacterised protein [[Clostridium] sordellii] [Paeniclostridium sordellii]
MDKSKKILIGLSILIGSLFIWFFNPNDEKIDGYIRVGVSDDTSGFVINYMINQKYFSDLDVENLIEPYSINDC